MLFNKTICSLNSLIQGWLWRQILQDADAGQTSHWIRASRTLAGSSIFDPPGHKDSKSQELLEKLYWRPRSTSGELAHGPPYPPKRNHQSGDAWVSLHQQVTRGKESGTVAGPTQRAAFSAWGSISRSPSRLLYVSRLLRPGDARQMRAGPPSLHKRGAMPTSPAPTKNA